MLDDWYRTLQVPMTIEQFHQLPRNPAYKYEYLNGKTWISPRPRTFNATLDLSPRIVIDPIHIQNEPLNIRPIADPDWAKLPKIFAGAFAAIPPFGALSTADRLKCSTDCIKQTRSGGDGVVLREACLIATPSESRHILGAILVTLIPKREEGDWWDGTWQDPPINEDARRLLGRPHLTWVFVAPMYAKHGLGSALLDRAVNALLQLRYSELASTFLMGNDSTTLWHWRNGFRLLPYPGSMRRIREKIENQEKVV